LEEHTKGVCSRCVSVVACAVACATVRKPASWQCKPNSSQTKVVGTTRFCTEDTEEGRSDTGHATFPPPPRRRAENTDRSAQSRKQPRLETACLHSSRAVAPARLPLERSGSAQSPRGSHADPKFSHSPASWCQSQWRWAVRDAQGRRPRSRGSRVPAPWLLAGAAWCRNFGKREKEEKKPLPEKKGKNFHTQCDLTVKAARPEHCSQPRTDLHTNSTWVCGGPGTPCGSCRPPGRHWAAEQRSSVTTLHGRLIRARGRLSPHQRQPLPRSGKLFCKVCKLVRSLAARVGPAMYPWQLSFVLRTACPGGLVFPPSCDVSHPPLLSVPETCRS
jgi:hypothetical protein